MSEFEKYAVKHLGIGSLRLHDYKKIIEPSNMTAHIIEERKMNAVIMSVFDRLMQDRIVMLGTEVNHEVANILCAQLLFLDSVDSERDINLYLNTPGGSVAAGNSILDVMEYIKSPVPTVNMGTAASMGAVILACGEKGKRSALKRSRTMIHQISGGFQGDYSEMRIQMEETKKFREELYRTLAERTGHSFDKIEKDCDRDYFMTAKEAKEYKIIDFIL